MNVLAFIICKNEESNIDRCIRALKAANLRVIALDSGSSDRTRDIAREHGVEVRDHRYESHLATYNKVTSELSAEERCLIVDADMTVSAELVREVSDAFERGESVVRAPIEMVWAGHRLQHASLCPPKAFAFRGGRSYFVALGHSEKVAPDVRCYDAVNPIVHDDRKPYQTYLANQVRYSQSLLARLQDGQVSWKDRIRARTPLGIVAVPLVSYVVRRGFLDGRGGVIYALDRVIAEAIAFREALAKSDR